MGGRPLDICRRVWPAFYEHGRIGEADRSGREPLFEVADALRFAELLKGGKPGHMMRGGKKVPRLVYFTSADQCIRECPEAQELQRKYNASAAQLLAAAKYHDPDLQRRTVTYHPDFSAVQLADRSATAKAELDKLPSHPFSRQHRLDRYMWGDEASIVLSDQNLERIRVWCSKANFNLQDIVSLPQMTGHKDCKVRFFIVVSSHPAFSQHGGVVYWEFTTGTDNIRRRVNTLEQTHDMPFCYMVGASVFRNSRLP